MLRVALKLLDDAASRSGRSFAWSFGGGTVLMLRYRHRRSKDIDVFLRDAPMLGFLTPRLSSVAESCCEDYIEASEHVKLIRSDGEIDFVIAPHLTDNPVEPWQLMRRQVQVETAVEIVAKKL